MAVKPKTNAIMLTIAKADLHAAILGKRRVMENVWHKCEAEPRHADHNNGPAVHYLEKTLDQMIETARRRVAHYGG